VRHSLHIARETRTTEKKSKPCPSFDALGSTSAADVICAESDDAMDGLAHSYSLFHKISADFFI